MHKKYAQNKLLLPVRLLAPKEANDLCMYVHQVRWRALIIMCKIYSPVLAQTHMQAERDAYVEREEYFEPERRAQVPHVTPVKHKTMLLQVRRHIFFVCSIPHVRNAVFALVIRIVAPASLAVVAVWHLRLFVIPLS